jgi:hypothetical protein
MSCASSESQKDLRVLTLLDKVRGPILTEIHASYQRSDFMRFATYYPFLRSSCCEDGVSLVQAQTHVRYRVSRAGYLRDYETRGFLKFRECLSQILIREELLYVVHL